MQHSVVVEDNSDRNGLGCSPSARPALHGPTCSPACRGVTWAASPRRRQATSSSGKQGPALRPRGQPEPRSRATVAGQSPRGADLYLPREPGHRCAAPRCQPARRHSVWPNLAWCWPPCGATLWGHLVLWCGPCVMFDIGNLSTMGNALMLPPLPAAELYADTYVPDPPHCTGYACQASA